MTSFRPMHPEEAWRARVTDDDIHAARSAWWHARERGDSPVRVAELWDDLVRLFRAEAEQVARDLREHAGRRQADVPRQRSTPVPD